MSFCLCIHRTGGHAGCSRLTNSYMALLDKPVPDYTALEGGMHGMFFMQQHTIFIFRSFFRRGLHFAQQWIKIELFSHIDPTINSSIRFDFFGFEKTNFHDRVVAAAPAADYECIQRLRHRFFQLMTSIIKLL